jgi:superfamily II DNA/RNA helicase
MNFEIIYYFKEILKRIPESRQTLLFSATLPKMLVDFAKAGLCNPTLSNKLCKAFSNLNI